MHADAIFRRRAIRAALSIHDHLASPGARIWRPDLPTATWEELCRTIKRLQLSTARGWRTASQCLVEDLDYSLRTLDRELSALRGQLSFAPSRQQLNPPRDLVADLEALAEEFETVVIDLKLQTLSVVTEPIELEGTYLGSFRIALRWNLIGVQNAYEVIATEPCAAEGDGDVTHPHVRDQALCEGDGAAPIKSALAQGRLLDFFTLVSQILQTYNAESAHVALDRWDGVNCRDCGWRMPSDDHGRCERCDAPLCSECSIGCSGCSRYICPGCSGECATCGSYFCNGCLVTGADSERELCEPCLHHQHEENHDSEEDESPDASASCPTEGQVPRGATAPLHALCLGEAAVPA